MVKLIDGDDFVFVRGAPATASVGEVPGREEVGGAIGQRPWVDEAGAEAGAEAGGCRRRREERGEGEERRERRGRREKRERRDDKWVLPSRDVHVSKTTHQTARWPNINDFKILGFMV